MFVYLLETVWGCLAKKPLIFHLLNATSSFHKNFTYMYLRKVNINKLYKIVCYLAELTNNQQNIQCSLFYQIFIDVYVVFSFYF